MSDESNWFTAYEHLTFDRRPNRVLLITINRPEVDNAVNARLHLELADVWRDVARDPLTNVAVITGAGRAFCAGGELGSFGSDPHPSSAAIDESMHGVTSLVSEMINCAKPVIAAVNGLAMASGLAVALSADISVVADDATLNDGHLRGGMVAGDHAVLLWPLYMSLAQARYYLLTGDSMSGREAERLGLVSLSVPAAEVLARSLQIADRVATNAQFAVRWTKRALNSWVRQQAPLFEMSTALQMLTLYGDDMAEAMTAITSHRKPRFPSATAPESTP
jgi:enoyl-CoA hydratase